MLSRASLAAWHAPHHEADEADADHDLKIGDSFCPSGLLVPLSDMLCSAPSQVPFQYHSTIVRV